MILQLIKGTFRTGSNNAGIRWGMALICIYAGGLAGGGGGAVEIRLPDHPLGFFSTLVLQAKFRSHAELANQSHPPPDTEFLPTEYKIVRNYY